MAYYYPIIEWSYECPGCSHCCPTYHQVQFHHEESFPSVCRQFRKKEKHEKVRKLKIVEESTTYDDPKKCDAEKYIVTEPED